MTESPAPGPVSLARKLALFSDPWNPRVVAELNGQMVKLGRLKGAFVWHSHANEDEMFLVLEGRFRMELRTGDQWVEKGEFIVIPRGVEHRPVAEEDCAVMLFEPATTLNTGGVRDALTRERLERI
jgi:mannose-6-phosphate isomerase-like protein (cupin superfamily)